MRFFVFQKVFFSFQLLCPLCFKLTFAIIIKSCTESMEKEGKKYCDINFSLFLLSLLRSTERSKRNLLSKWNVKNALTSPKTSFSHQHLHRSCIKVTKCLLCFQRDSFLCETIYSNTKNIAKVSKIPKNHERKQKRGKKRERERERTLASVNVTL